MSLKAYNLKLDLKNIGADSYLFSKMFLTINNYFKISAFGSASPPAFGSAPAFGGAATFGGSPSFGSPGKVFGSPTASPPSGI